MPKFSANLGYLWADLPLPEGIRAAARAGFDAVECHWPYNEDPGAIRAALAETGLPMLSLNTVKGDGAQGEFGLAALPGREAQARAAIDQAFDYAAQIGAGAVHVLAGKAEGAEAAAVYVANLAHACARAEAEGRVVLIEALNKHDVPGYFLRDTDHVVEVIGEVGSPALKLMFDCYHVARAEGDVLGRLHALLPHIGHVQFAGVPERGNPMVGTLDYAEVFAEFDRIGWAAPLGAEYRPGGPTEASLGWMPDRST